MKLNSIGKALSGSAALLGLVFSQSDLNAQAWKLIGISGQFADTTPADGGGFQYPDNTIFQISTANGAITKLFTATFVPDSHSIGFDPVANMLYHTGGAGAYRDDPLRTGTPQGQAPIPGLAFQDNFYVEKINLATQVATGVINANPCPNPDPTLPCFGLVAPRPAWALPTERRDSTQTASTFRQQGPDEYSALRGMAYSMVSNIFYVSDGDGIYTLTTSGDSKFLARPAFPIDNQVDEAKAIAFVVTTNLYVGHRNGAVDPADETLAKDGYLMRLNPKTGAVIGQIRLRYPEGGADPVGSFAGLLGMSQHPTTGVLYGIRNTSEVFQRELVTIDPQTGLTKLVGNMGMHIASIAFVQENSTSPWKLYGITGQQGDPTPADGGGFQYPDNTMFEISLANGSITKLFTATFIPDSHSIGYNSDDGMLYHTGGAGAYRDDPLRTGTPQGAAPIPGLAYQDNYYIEKINVATRVATGVINANPCPNPDPTLPCFGLVAPRPAWALPTDRRDSTQTASTFRQQGTNEYSALRGMAWSAAEKVFYVSDGDGIYKVTAAGESTFLARPAFPIDGKLDESKAIAFVVTTNLVVGHRNGVVDPLDEVPVKDGYIMQLNPDTGAVIGQLRVRYPEGGGEPVDAFGGILGLTQDPVTGLVYAIRQTAEELARELVTIDMNTGESKLVGSMGMHISSIAFARDPGAAGLRLAVAAVGPGSIDITWTGGSGKFLVQRKVDLNSTNWINLLTTTERRATVVKDLANGFYRIVDNYTGPDVIPLTAYMTPDGEPGALVGNPTGFGYASVSLEGTDKLNYIVTYTGLTTNASGLGASNGHVHFQSGDSTTSGGTGGGGFVPTPSGTSGTYTGVNTITQANRDLILGGKGYVNIHTALNGGGELRGQLLRNKYVATLNGANQVPAVTTSATGSATVEIYGNELRYNVSFTGLQGGDAGSAHIHGRATTTASAGVLFGFTGVPAATSGSFSGVGTASTATRNAIVDGLAYVNIHTPNINAGNGEIRGQLTPAP